eukprot:4313189-Amphidinium_carterae.1
MTIVEEDVDIGSSDIGSSNKKRKEADIDIDSSTKKKRKAEMMVDANAKAWFKSWYNHMNAKHGWSVESCLALAKQWAPD